MVAMNLFSALYKEMLRTDVSVVQNPHDPNRWFITVNNPGFNSPTNNSIGYKSKADAEAAIRHFSSLKVLP